jgi:uncharacterized membrane protein
MNDSSQDNTPAPGRTETVIGTLLRIGVAVSAAVVAIGGAVYLARHGAEAPHVDAFRGEPSDLRSVEGVVRSTFMLSGRGIIQFGLLVLIATPVMRVMVSLASFARQREWLYVGFTALVLALLLFSLLGA